MIFSTLRSNYTRNRDRRSTKYKHCKLFSMQTREDLTKYKTCDFLVFFFLKVGLLDFSAFYKLREFLLKLMPVILKSSRRSYFSGPGFTNLIFWFLTFVSVYMVVVGITLGLHCMGYILYDSKNIWTV